MERDLILNVRLAYIDVLEARAMLAVARDSLGSEERYLMQTRAFVEAGQRRLGGVLTDALKESDPTGPLTQTDPIELALDLWAPEAMLP